MEKADSTLRSTQAVPHPSTDRALRCLTSEVKRDPVHSTRYGRRRHGSVKLHSRSSCARELNYEGCSARVAKKRSGCQEKRETSNLAFCAAKISR